MLYECRSHNGYPAQLDPAAGQRVGDNRLAVDDHGRLHSAQALEHAGENRRRTFGRRRQEHDCRPPQPAGNDSPAFIVAFI
jgi:hypothetical protein